jgi:hypothetical protein
MKLFSATHHPRISLRQLMRFALHAVLFAAPLVAVTAILPPLPDIGEVARLPAAIAELETRR